MHAELTWAERRQDKELDELVHSDRVDMGVTLHVVCKDPAGAEYIRGKPKLRILRSHHRGGMLEIDGKNSRWVGRSLDPVVWYCSEDAEPLILHDDSLPDSLLVYGSEGAGKTTAQAMWCFFRALERISQGYRGEIGMTAPVAERLGFIKKAITDTWSPRWYRWIERRSAFEMHAGISIKLRATKVQSEASGSPIQGYNWSDSGNDEIQDSLDADSDIESRLRDAPGGRGKRFATATSKDHPDFRTWRDRQLSARVNGKPAWLRAEMLAQRSPFLTQEFIDRKKSTMSKREYERRYLAKDLGPERQVYYAWRRTHDDGTAANLRPIPMIGAAPMTTRELGRFGQGLALLAGHDPGRRQDVTLLLQAFEFANIRLPNGQLDLRPRWFVVDEITTEGEIHEAHVKKVLDTARTKYRCNLLDHRGRPDQDSSRIFVRIDPHTQSGDEHPGTDLYAIWRKYGILTSAARYAPNSTRPMGIKPEERIDLINTLLCDANDTRRLFVACDEHGTPAAPKLVEAFETMERNLVNQAEWERKDGRDKSHWPAALGYALWSIEHPRAGSVAA